MTVAQIADAVDISVKTLFTYFAPKADLAFGDESILRDELVERLADDGWLLGVATGTLNFFKTIGGAFGAASRPVRRDPERLPVRHATRGRRSRPRSPGLFRWTVLCTVVTLVLALIMREQPLSEEMHEVTAGNVEVSEY